MTYLTRSHWGAEPPLRTLPVSAHLKGVCLHWMGFAIHDDPATIVRSIQKNHMGPPKNWWDVAYNELISLGGEVVEGRGLTIRGGANGSTKTNKDYVALGLLLGPGQRPTDEMVQAVRERIAVVRYFQPEATKIVGHKDLKPTTCPGPHVQQMIRFGDFEPNGGDAPQPDPPPEALQAQIDAIKQELHRLHGKVENLEARVP